MHIIQDYKALKILQDIGIAEHLAQ